MVTMWIVIGVVIVALLVAAAVVDIRDRGRGGERRIRMPRWGARRSQGALGSGPIDWDADPLRSPREEEGNEHR
ncbi:hypothetical protein [Amycolatopsis sp. GM8]|uniref:hypothetical protein n=1 Tax=Amycolatopsis sp. GM8 TaxID=2896530 RepID=UPI001F46F681|nr:hypothetical protein [Amycolatopsis sp. GM8]